MLPYNTLQTGGLIKMDTSTTKRKYTKCPICGEELIAVDDLNYFTSICPKCYSAVFEETNGALHVIENGIAQDGYNVSLDIFYKQLQSDQMAMHGILDNIDLGVIVFKRIFHIGIYHPSISKHFMRNIENFKVRARYIYFDGYEKYLKITDEYVTKNYPWLFVE